MLGLRTALVLGAGASYCYEDGHSNVPIQGDIVGRLFFGGFTGGGEGYPSFTGPSGPKHSFRLARYLRTKFAIPEQPQSELGKMDFWKVLQERGYHLESLFADLEHDLPPDDEPLLEEFKAILRTAVLEPSGDRALSKVCRYHRMLTEHLEPGDYIVDFNWDALMADALLYYSHFWFPMTGFGIPLRPLIRPGQKAFPIASLVHLYQLHGSVVLFEKDHTEQEAGSTHSLLYLGPEQYSPLMAFMRLEGLTELTPGSHAAVPARPENAEAGERLLGLGHILLDDNEWYSPVFVSPSRAKHEYQHWYYRWLKRAIHTHLPRTEAIVFAGYSFPEADYQYLADVFVSRVIPERTRIQVVNPQNSDEGFRHRVSHIFTHQGPADFTVTDFREYCKALGHAPEVPSQDSGPDDLHSGAPTLES
jgi:hypothetical protein